MESTKETKKKILLVDDDPAVRTMLKDAFEFLGYEVLEAEDGEQGLEIFVSNNPDLVISDIYMPRMNGLHLLRNIRRKNFHARIILMTGFSHYRQLVADQNSRPDGYFEKPFIIADVAKAVESLINTPEGELI